MTADRHLSTTGAWRTARGAVVGLCASGLATAAHTGAGGVLPEPGLWAALTLLAMCAGVLASRWQWHTATLVGMLVATQLGFHAAFAVLGGPVHVGGHHGASVADPALLPSLPMAASHLAAAVVLGVLLRFGERGLRAALDALVLRAVRVLEAVIPVPRVPGHQPIAASGAVLVMHDPAYARWSRGPPR